jgi:hypothetical protein
MPPVLVNPPIADVVPPALVVPPELVPPELVVLPELPPAAVEPPLVAVEPPLLFIEPPLLGAEPPVLVTAASTPAVLPPELAEDVPPLAPPVCAASFVVDELEHAANTTAADRKNARCQWIRKQAMVMSLPHSAQHSRRSRLTQHEALPHTGIDHTRDREDRAVGSRTGAVVCRRSPLLAGDWLVVVE